jgi:hypothetical protein
VDVEVDVVDAKVVDVEVVDVVVDGLVDDGLAVTGGVLVDAAVVVAEATVGCGGVVVALEVVVVAPTLLAGPPVVGSGSWGELDPTGASNGLVAPARPTAATLRLAATASAAKPTTLAHREVLARWPWPRSSVPDRWCSSRIGVS